MESNGSSINARPGVGPQILDSPGSLGITTQPGGATATVSDHGSKTTAQLAIIVASIALGMCLILSISVYGLWSRYDLLRIFYDDIKAELIRQGGNPHPHFPGESP